jgi:hypothetical protein
VKRFVCGLLGAGLIWSLAYADERAGTYIPSKISAISATLFTKFGTSGEYARIKPEDFDTTLKGYLDENHISVSGANPGPGKPNSAGRVFLTFNGQTRSSCVDNANLAVAQHQNRPSMFSIQINDMPIDGASEIEDSCKAPPHRLVIILRPN